MAANETTNLTINPQATPVRSKDVNRSYYLITIPGILKILQMIFDAVCFIRMRAAPSTEHKRAFWLSFASGSGFCLTCMLFVFFCFNLIDRSRKLTWILETIYCILWTVFLSVTAIIVFIWGIRREGYITAAVFGILATIFYSVDAFYKCRSWMRNDFTFGDKHVIAALRRKPKPTETTTPTATSVTVTPTAPPPIPNPS